MSYINEIQNAINKLEGGAFQSLFDEYLFKKYKFNNIQTLGVQTGTHKTTKGTPDSYVENEDGKYILINYGTVTQNPVRKIKDDIESCLDKAKLDLDEEKIEKIICGYSSTNISIGQREDIKNSFEGIEIQLIGIDTLSHELATKYPSIAKDYLNISVDSNQIFSIEDFIEIYDRNSINAPMKCDCWHREKEIEEAIRLLSESNSLVLTGASGIGKTRLVLEICREYEKKGYKCLCVKSNGASLYKDLRRYLDEEGNYLLFFDDANMVASFNNVLDYIITLPDGFSIKIIITVRDYAKTLVLESLSHYVSDAREYFLEGFSDDDIKDILKKNLGIEEKLFLERVSRISNGNIRLAMLAGIRFNEYGIETIMNAEDIFKNYYGNVLSESGMTRDEIIMLFLVSFLGPLRTENNVLFKELQSKYLSNSNVEELIENLYMLELVDWYKEKIATVSDQSLGNYILYFVLYEKQWIDLKELVCDCFVEKRKKVVFLLNTLMELFCSEDLKIFIKKCVNSAWDECEASNDILFMESFSNLNPLRALSSLKQYVDNTEEIDYCVKLEEIEENKNNIIISTKEIEILSTFKHSEQFENAFELLLRLFEKRPDLIKEVYHAIVGNMLYDKESYEEKYKKEAFVLDKIWEKCNEGKNRNMTALYIFVAEKALTTEFTFSEETNKSHTFQFVRMCLLFCDETKEIRNRIWSNLAKIRSDDIYKRKINEIIEKIHISELHKDKYESFLLNDFETVYNLLAEGKEINFAVAKTISAYKEAAINHDIEIDKRFERAYENECFKIYDILSKTYIRGKTFKETEKIKREIIKEEIKDYSEINYGELFEKCCYLEKTCPGDAWYMCRGLYTVFSLLESDIEKYKKALKQYFLVGLPFKICPERPVEVLLNHMGYQESISFLIESGADNEWLYCVWKSLEEDDISDNVVRDFSSFIKESFETDDDFMLEMNVLSKYSKFSKNLSRITLNRLSDKPELARKFLHTISTEEAEELVIIFSDNYEMMTDIYISALDNHLDYYGIVFKKLYENDSSLWKKYLGWLKNNRSKNDRDQTIIDTIWMSDEYKERINAAFELVFDSYLDFERMTDLLFSSTKKELVQRKKEWILNRIIGESDDTDIVNKLIQVVAIAYPESKNDYLLEFIEKNRNIDDFKKIHIFPSSESYSGSYIPVIDRKIDSIKELKNRMKGADYLEHQYYLDQKIEYLENIKEQEELSEYFENN